MSERYRVGALYQKPDVEIAVEADSPDEARAKARPILRARGVSEDDPLVTERVRSMDTDQ